MMITKRWTNDSGTQYADIFIPDHINKIGINLSSGKDSALCLYFLCDYIRENKRKNIEIVCAHLIDFMNVPTSQADFDLMVDKYAEEFPEIKFSRQYHQFTETPKMTKGMAQRVLELRLFKECGVRARYTGATRPPPKSILEEIRIEKQADKIPDVLLERRSISMNGRKWITYGLDENSNVTHDFENCHILLSNPLLTTDSYFSVEMYKKIPFMKNVIFPLTKSCVSSNIINTKAWTQPCKRCWWCIEKKKIFGAYDGETLN